jgi:hypothetical protein
VDAFHLLCPHLVHVGLPPLGLPHRTPDGGGAAIRAAPSG